LSVIVTKELSRHYGTRLGIDRVELEVSKGEIFGFLGPNGAGKTTTIRILLGMMRPSGGSAVILGLDCWRESSRIKREVGYLPGDVRLYPWLTAESALSISGKVRGQNLRAFGGDLIERLGLERNLPVKRMSRGTRQKLAIVLALAHRPQVLILDEPTAGLDPLIQAELAHCLRELAEQGHTVFFSSHTLSEVEQLCKSVAVVRSGRIVANETIESLRRRAGRVVTIWFPDKATANDTVCPPWLNLLERTDNTWRGEIAGDARRLVDWAATLPLEDITIESPSLDSLFRRYYRDNEATEE